MKKHITLKQALLRTNIVYSVLIIGIFSVIMSQKLYEAEAAKADVLVQQQNETISVAIKSHYAKITSLINATTHLDFVRNSAANPHYQEALLEHLRVISSSNPEATFVYVGYDDGSILINDYEVPEGYDGRKRPWYKSAMDAAPNIFMAEPFLDAGSNGFMLSVGKVFYADDGTSGVMVIGSPLEIMTKILNPGSAHYQSLTSFVVDSQGKILLHRNSEKANRNVFEAFESEQSERQSLDALSLKDKIVFSSVINDKGWRLISKVDREEAYSPVLAKVSLMTVLLSSVMLVFAIISSALLNRLICGPLIKLHRHVQDIVENKNYGQKELRLPNTEGSPHN